MLHGPAVCVDDPGSVLILCDELLVTNIITPIHYDMSEGLLDDAPEDIEDLDMTHGRLKGMSKLNLPRFKYLKVCSIASMTWPPPFLICICFSTLLLQRVNLRQNLIPFIGGIENMPQMEDLDLYDNRIVAMENMEGVPNLT
jgi:hypothetical protein